jgi:hypothetical protein
MGHEQRSARERRSATLQRSAFASEAGAVDKDGAGAWPWCARKGFASCETRVRLGFNRLSMGSRRGL